MAAEGLARYPAPDYRAAREAIAREAESFLDGLTAS